MRFIIPLSAIIALSSAIPAPQLQPNRPGPQSQPNRPGPQPQPNRPAPPDIGTQVVNALNYVSTQYATIITEIQQFGGNPYIAGITFQHSEETLRSLDAAIRTINLTDSFTVANALSLVSPLTSMDFQVHQMAS